MIIKMLAQHYITNYYLQIILNIYFPLVSHKYREMSHQDSFRHEIYESE